MLSCGRVVEFGLVATGFMTFAWPSQNTNGANPAYAVFETPPSWSFLLNVTPL
jgi:hypothetical protein